MGEEPHPNNDAVVGKTRRQDISGSDNAKIAVFPTKQSGEEFLRENNAWGFVDIGQNPEFVTMYASHSIGQIKYIAKVEEIKKASQADLARAPEEYDEPASNEAQAGYDSDQYVVVFEKDSLHELEDPIPYKNKYPPSLRYTTLGELRSAETTDDLL